MSIGCKKLTNSENDFFLLNCVGDVMSKLGQIGVANEFNAMKQINIFLFQSGG